MIVLACGDRNWHDRPVVEATLEHLRTRRVEDMIVVEGGCSGADAMAGRWAARHRAVGVGWVRMPADWAKHGKRAGPIRNQAMLDYVLQGRAMGRTVGVLAFHDDLENSRGTKDMVSRARHAGVPVKVVSHSLEGVAT